MSSPDTPEIMTRREALQRAAVLFGLAISPSLLTRVVQAQTAPAAPAGRARFMAQRRFDIAAAAAERILPRTGTPGAADVGVPAFLDLMYGEYLTPAEREQFTNGLDGIEVASLSAYQQGFARLSSQLQNRVLQAIAETANEQGNPFFNQLKELVVLGYFSSEEVAKRILRYEPSPGPYQGCIPANEVGPATWTPSR
jgi:hypothetical protein